MLDHHKVVKAEHILHRQQDLQIILRQLDHPQRALQGLQALRGIEGDKIYF
jgi:hypothetical protein